MLALKGTHSVHFAGAKAHIFVRVSSVQKYLVMLSGSRDLWLGMVERPKRNVSHDSLGCVRGHFIPARLRPSLASHTVILLSALYLPGCGLP